MPEPLLAVSPGPSYPGVDADVLVPVDVTSPIGRMPPAQEVVDVPGLVICPSEGAPPLIPLVLVPAQRARQPPSERARSPWVIPVPAEVAGPTEWR